MRQAKTGDAGRLSEIALAAKRHWGYPEEWIELWRNELTVEAGYLRGNAVYVAELDLRAVGFVALVDLGTGEAEIEHLWVLPSRMGRGIGRALMQRALLHCRTAGTRCLLVASDPNAAGFYQKLGAVYHGNIDSTPALRTLPVLRFDERTINREEM